MNNNINKYVTGREIYHQPEVWKKTFKIIEDKKKELEIFLEDIINVENIRIIFTGAGTSGFIGDTVVPYIKNKFSNLDVESVHTTDIVSHPETYFKSNIPILLISFARSGNSPESVATVKLAEDLIDNLYQIVFTCNLEGELAKNIDKAKNKLILLPEESNDKGFAMTSSYTSMVLASLLFFSIDEIEYLKRNIYKVFDLGIKALENTETIEKIASISFNKIIYLGTNSFYGLARESSLKLLELTAGKIVTRYDSPLGFRHGPKSIVDDETLIVIFLSRNDYSRKYEYDLIRELSLEEGRHKVLVISETLDKSIEGLSDYYIYLSDEELSIDERFNSINYIIYPQILGLLESIKLGINPDNPSPEGSVNRVVQGVKIYPYDK
ncbi:SIS domain-containing protein [Clostridium sp. D2Q-14]|uniref:SIS domain-containing protein n=1 Tax=Anaeromonas gelatinilytica TaxID=2683194 RepID=UPI00193BADDB|nr:SIS domain-containing protein [Anaeromonas gelatinilytica]MBS4535763.1 SIS domain-containing protein [Anaeromonas gelatinilytica]